MNWTDKVIKNMKRKIELENMISSSVDVCINELRDTINQHEELKTRYDIRKYGTNTIKVNTTQITISYNSVIEEICKKPEISLELVSQESINTAVHEIISSIFRLEP